ncbi:MAG: lipoprotein-releasing system permease protein [Candidatus Dependentiae bacterium]|nr:lipoprotein-releasing system permease protein [Candidatus Dependentiae bacterium]
MKQNVASHLLASAYLSSTRAPRALQTIKLLCYIGIAIGSGALMLALIITQGFERDVSLKMKGISSDVVIESPGNQLETEQIGSYIREHLGSAVHGISGSSVRHLIVTHNDQSRVLFVRGIDPINEAQTTTLEQKITTPQKATLASLLNSESAIVVGKQFAAQNNLWLGSELTVYVPQEGGKSKIALEKKTMHIAGIFHLGLEDYDMNIAYCSTPALKKMYEQCRGADQIAVTFAPPPWERPALSISAWLKNNWNRLRIGNDLYYAAQVRRLHSLLPGLCVRGWRELYPDLVASLQLEKYAMSIALGLIALVASMLIICLLFMFLQYKQQDIAILQTLGMSRRAIAALFTRIGMTIVAQAVGTGIGIAWTLGWFIDTYKPITLPDIYYIAYLPAALEPIHALVVAGGTLLLGLIACQLPLQQLKQFSVVQVLRGN